MAFYGTAISSIFPTTDRSVFTKDSYTALVKKQRKEYVHLYFSATLDSLFDDLKKDAIAMKQCHKEVTFDVPNDFDFVKTESVLRDYFIDIGYKPLIENRKDGKLIITIT